MNYRNEAVDLIHEERDRQEELGKPSRNSFAVWTLILNKYLGEISNTVLEFSNKDVVEEDELKDFLKQITKLGAVSVAFLEDASEVVDVVTKPVPPAEETLEVTFADEVEVEVSEELGDIEAEFVNE